MKLRSEVLQFAEAMEHKLRQHDAEEGDSWRDASRAFLQARLDEEVQELHVALKSHCGECGCRVGPQSKTRVLSEAADVGNFAMFIAYVSGCFQKD